MSNISVIINADDLGYSKDVNSEIGRFAENNLITSVSILANGPDLLDGLKVIKEYPNLSVGAHLNITEFGSLSNSQVFRDYSLIDANSNFTGVIKYRKHIKPFFNRFIIDAIYDEWEMQIYELLDKGVPISHLDSHNMVHYWDELFPVIKRLQKKFNIKVVRMKDVKPLSFYGLFNNKLPHKTPPLFKELSNFYWNKKVKYCPPKSSIVDHVFSYNSLCYYLSTGSTCPKKGVFEVIVHPGLDYMDYFEKENKLVEERRLEQLLPDYRMISFKNLL